MSTSEGRPRVIDLPPHLGDLTSPAVAALIRKRLAADNPRNVLVDIDAAARTATVVAVPARQVTWSQPVSATARPTHAAQAAALEVAQPGCVLVAFDPHRGATVARLDPVTSRLRGQIARELQCERWEVTVTVIDVVDAEVTRIGVAGEGVAALAPEARRKRLDHLAQNVVGHAGWRVVMDESAASAVLELWDDPLRQPVGALPIPDRLDQRRGPQVGWTDTGAPWHVPVAETHTLLAGASGSGKGSVIWSYLRGCIPAIRAGEIEVWGIDLKGGVEFSMGREFFARMAMSAEEAADLLADAVVVMQMRLADLRGRARKHLPGPGDPTVLVMIDEMAAITSYVTDAALKKQIAADMALLLTQGRAPGVLVFGALQDPKANTLPQRDSFFARILLRMLNEHLVDNILGDGAIAAGAETWRISPKTPGVGYVMTTDPVTQVQSLSRVRAAYVDDDDLRVMAEGLGVRPPSVFADRLAAAKAATSGGAASGGAARGGKRGGKNAAQAGGGFDDLFDDDE